MAETRVPSVTIEPARSVLDPSMRGAVAASPTLTREAEVEAAAVAASGPTIQRKRPATQPLIEPIKPKAKPVEEERDVKKQTRAPSSFAGTVLAEKCGIAAGNDTGCTSVKAGTKCTVENIRNLQCDLRTLLVPPYYISEVDNDPRYEVYNTLNDARKMILQFMCAQKMFYRAAQIITVYTKKAQDRHLLDFEGWAVSNNAPDKLAPPNVASGVSLYPASHAVWNPITPFHLENQSEITTTVSTPVSYGTMCRRISDFYGVRVNKLRTYTLISSDNAAILSNAIVTAVAIKNDPDVHVTQEKRLYANTFSENGRTYLVNEPFVIINNADGTVRANPKYIHQKYINDMNKYFGIGKGMLLSAFEHLRAASLLFIKVSMDANARQLPEIHNLLDYEYNALLITSGLLRYMPIGNIEGHEPYTDTVSRTVFKRRILSFKHAADWLVYHIFTEVFVQCFTIENIYQNKAKMQIIRRNAYADAEKKQHGITQMDIVKFGFIETPRTAEAGVIPLMLQQ